MSPSPQLHPSVRERHEPRISTTALAEYLIMHADDQERILHDARFSTAPIVTANGDAMRALRAYNVDVRRDKSALDMVKAALTRKSLDVNERPKSRDEAKRCCEAIDLFERNENALGMRKLPLATPPRFEALLVEGVSLSVRPDFIVHGAGDRVGAGILRVAKAPDPDACKLEDTRKRRGEHRREMARYMLAMLQLLLEDQSEVLGLPDRDLCFVADVRLGERIVPATDHSVRVRRIRGACRQIASLWTSIEPRPSILRRG
jgi:hypothetical protein